MRETQILLTGGTGFFGRALLRNWQSKQNAGHTVPEVTVLSRSPDAFQAQYPEFSGLSWLTLHLGDITEPDSFPQGQKYSHVLHAATDSTLGPQILPMQRYDQIVEGTRNILDFAISCNARRFLLISSGGVYGPQPAELEQIPEDYHAMPDPLDSGNVYSVAKSASEHLCALYNETYGLHTVIARCFAFVGKDLPLDAHFAIGNFIRDALWRDEIVVGGDGMPVRSYLDQRDLADWLVVLLMQGAANRAYNVGSDQAISIGELAHLVRDVVAPRKVVRVLGQANAGNGKNLYIPAISRVRQEMGLDITFPLRAAIKMSA